MANGPATGGPTSTSLDPVDCSPSTDIAGAQPEDVDAAVAAAQHAFDHSGWVEMGGAERGRTLYAAKNISALVTLEVGKLYRDGLMGDRPANLP